MAGKEKNFVSAVIYLGEEKDQAAPFLQMLTGRLAARFEQYELVFVEDASRDGTEAGVKDLLSDREVPPPVTMGHMSLRRGLELARNAGLEMAGGKVVYEYESLYVGYPSQAVY